MEWMNRGEHAPQGPVSAGPTQAASTGHGRKSRRDGISWLRGIFVVLLFSGTILIVALLLLVVRGGNTDEGKYIDKTKYQAVFLNGGQVYFGKIKSLDSKYMRVNDIYYLRVNQQVQPNQSSTSTSSNDISLVKLGCELHGPQDQMQINREQIIFWENLKSDGQVAKAVATYQKQNPNGQKCETTSASSSSSDTSTLPASSSSTTTTTPKTSTTSR